MRKIFKYLIILILFSNYSIELSGQIDNKELDNIFTIEEVITLNKIITFYDSIILSKTKGDIDIESAYFQYFDSIFPISIKNESLTCLAINKVKRTRFLLSLKQENLKEIYEIRDSITYYYRGKTKTKYSPYILSLNFNGKYVKFLKYYSDTNNFLLEYVEDMEAAGGISPVNSTKLSYNYRDLNLNDPKQRLVTIIHLLIFDDIIWN